MSFADVDRIRSAVLDTGLLARGGFHPTSADGVPPLPGGQAVGTLVLLGNAGHGMWRKVEPFLDSVEARELRHPLEEWCRRVIAGLARRLGAQPVFLVSAPPHLPFQRWAQRAEPVWPSPLGVLLHAEYGSWHAYRGALAFAERFDLPPRPPGSTPCGPCLERPCLSACPVAAFTVGGYDVRACVGHLGSPRGTDCMERGCRARRACPVGRGFHYLPAQARFHMRAFLGAHRRLEARDPRPEHGGQRGPRS